jgi:hypothetical protein
MRRWRKDYSRCGETDNRKEKAPPERGQGPDSQASNQLQESEKGGAPKK